MPRRRRAPAAPFELQPAVEQRGHLPQPVDADARGGELDRQSNAVQLAADLRKDLRVLVGDVGPVTGRGGALHEQACRRIIHHLALR